MLWENYVNDMILYQTNGIPVIAMIRFIDGLVQNSSISIANALEILESCTKPSIY